MNYLTYFFEKTIPDPLRHKLMADSTMFPELSDVIVHGDTIPDAFYPDGTPTHYDDNEYYPCYLAHYLGTTMPSDLLNMTDGFRRSAARSAIRWIHAVLPDVTSQMPKHINGECVAIQHNGEVYSFLIPDISVTYTESGCSVTCPVLPFPDVRGNGEAWEDGCLPSHAEEQALLTLWLCRASYEDGKRSTCPEKAFVVRITGNTPSDIQIRTVSADTARMERLIRRLFKVLENSSTKNQAAIGNVDVQESLSWRDKKQEAQNQAYLFCDEANRQKLRQYMALRSDRKALDAQAQEMKNEMDEIALRLASMIPDAASGTVTDGSRIYTIKHSPKARKQATISADLLMQFFPDLASEVISYATTEKGQVSIRVIS